MTEHGKKSCRRCGSCRSTRATDALDARHIVTLQHRCTRKRREIEEKQTTAEPSRCGGWPRRLYTRTVARDESSRERAQATKKRHLGQNKHMRAPQKLNFCAFARMVYHEALLETSRKSNYIRKV